MDSSRQKPRYTPSLAEITRRYRLSPPIFRFWRGGKQEWASVTLIFLTLAIAIWSIEQAKWITPQPSLTLVLGLAILTGWLLAKSQLPDAARYPLMMVFGIVVTVWQSSSLLPLPEATSSSSHLIASLQSWWQAISTDKPNEGTIHFAVFLVFLSWMISYISTWFILRKQNAWIAVSLGTIIILVNLSNLTEEYYHFFPIYFLAAMLLIGQTNLSRDRNWFQKYGTNYPNRGMVYFMASVIALSILTVSTAWFTPEIRVKQLESVISAQIPWEKNAEKYWLNLFAAVPGKWNIIRSSQQETLLFSDTIDYSKEIQFVITAEQPFYWRTRRYDTYHSWGWTSNNATSQTLKPATPVTEYQPLPNRQGLTYIVENKLKTDVLLIAGEFIATDIPVLLQTITAERSATSPPASSADNPLPADEASATPSAPVTPAADTEPGLAEDIVTVITPQLLKPNQRYLLTASISSATPAELSQAGADYPQWVIDYYLQLPDSLPERVWQFSQELTEGAATAYDKVIIIKRFLNKFKYNQKVNTFPEEIDGVDYFLFKQQEGDCVNFASAMTVMLRSVGVPARFTTGYLKGRLNKNNGQLIVRARDYHAWPEVYFPGYGWVEFEATTRLENDGDGDIFNESNSASSAFDPANEEEMMGGSSGTALEGSSRPRQSGPNTPFTISIQLLVVLALAIIPYYWLRRFTRAENAFTVYARMSFLASLVQSGPKPPETPLEYCARLVSILPVQAEAINNIAQTYVESRFSPRKKLFLLQKVSLQQSWREVYRALLQRLLHLRR